MELITVKHEDFTLTIECGKWEGIWQKAKSNVREDSLYSTYSWTSGVQSVVLTIGDADNAVELVNGGKSKGIFFDNADYPIWVDFNTKIKEATFDSELQNVEDSFSFHKKRQVLSGFLNYGNEIGKSEIRLGYVLESGEKRRFIFGYEVLSSKLDYHEHWARIVEDIEAEYRMLTIDYLKRTFHTFRPDENPETPELAWWSIFRNEQYKFLNSIKRIIDQPCHKLRANEFYQRADRLKQLTPLQEQQLQEHRKNPRYLYRAEEHIQSNDTVENRFLKHALAQVATRYDKLKKAIEAQRNLSHQIQKEMDDTQTTMSRLRHHSFFRGIGTFKGFTQESLVLQKASDYSQVYRSWCLLKKGYSLQDGQYRLQTKDIATLYEIWCFIEVSHIVKELIGEEVETDHKNRMEMNGMFTWDLGRGEDSRILFKKDGIQLAELVYNPKHTEKENVSISMENIVVKTVPQKPDIVLQLIKDDIGKGMKMTYLFDAKYRIGSKDNGVDAPPEDAINQMHRYRDAIYYQDHLSCELKKEIIGGYILFPGYAKTKEDVENMGFYKSIEEVNIGAFPLRPKDEQNRALLVDFIRELLDMPSLEMIGDSIAQKGLSYTDDPEQTLSRKWKRTKVLLFIDPYDTHWQKMENYESVALGLNFSRFSLKTVKSFAMAKYVAIVSQHLPENKKMRLCKVVGTADIYDAVDENTCLKRKFMESEHGEEERVYLKFNFNKNPVAIPTLDAKKVHILAHGSHNPKLVSMDEIINQEMSSSHQANNKSYAHGKGTQTDDTV